MATLIVTAKSDDIELLVHRASSTNWLESSHDVYMAEQKGRGVARKREPSWSDLEPWVEEQAVASLPTIKEGAPDAVIKDEAVKDELGKDDDDEKPPEIPPELPPDDSLANIEEYPPSLPEEGPPSIMEDESQQLPQGDGDGDGDLPTPADANLSEDEKSNERTLDESTHGRGLHKEESFRGEPPLPPEGEPPLLTFDESSEELSWEQDEQEHSTHECLNTSSSPQSTPLHVSGDTPHSTLPHIADPTPHQTVQMSDEEPVVAESPQPEEAVDDAIMTNTSTTTSSSDNGSSASEVEAGELGGGKLSSVNGLAVTTPSDGGLPSASGLLVDEDPAKRLSSSEHGDGLSEVQSLELDTSLEQDNVFTVTLKKGFRGLGFMLDKQRSLAEGREKLE